MLPRWQNAGQRPGASKTEPPLGSFPVSYHSRINNIFTAKDRNSVFEQAFKNIDDALHKEAGCASELDSAEQTSWLLFLKYLDSMEQDKAMEAELEGKA